MASDRLSFHDLPDHQLVATVSELAAHERDATARLIAALAELDARRLYLGEGCSSLFTYCTQMLHLSEHAAYGRIEAARAARQFPVILDMLADASITLTTVTLLSGHLTPANHRDVLDSARHKSKREVEQIVAGLRPLPPVPSAVRKLPAPRRSARLQTQPSDSAPAGDRVDGPAHPVVPTSATPLVARPSAVVPLAPARYKIQFTANVETYSKLRRAQELLRHSIPNGDPAAIFERALTLLVADLERRKLAATTRPRTGRVSGERSRRIPAAIRRTVWQRDGGQCAYVGTQGRCTERGFLEFHHVVPYAAGGATSAENLQLRCRSHNAYEADQYFGGPMPSLLRETPLAGKYELGPDRVDIYSARSS
jgi:hypothetical protein